MYEFFSKLFDDEGFVPRSQCGDWSGGLRELHTYSDAVIWFCFLAIPLILVYLVRKRRDLPFSMILWMFGGLIVFSGLTHLMDIVVFEKPLYRLSGVCKFVTAGFSVATVAALVPQVPTILSLRGPAELNQLNLWLGSEVVERRKAQAALARTVGELRQQEDFARLITDSASDAIISANDQGEIVAWNRGAQRIFGFTPGEIRGRQIAVLVPPKYVEAHRAGLARYTRTGQARVLGTTLELDGMRKSGEEFPMELCVDAWTSGDRKFFTAICRDVTERKRAIDEVRKLNEELEAFTYSVSHDLRAPLRAMNGYSRILLEDHAAKLDAEGQRQLGVVISSAERMGRLIDDLLEFSRLGRASIVSSTVDMGELAQEVLGDLLAIAPGRSIEVKTGEIPPAWGDRSLLKQVLANLLSNSIKYTGTREAALIELGGSMADGETTYWVRDNGVGFDMEYAHKLFGVFQRLHSDKDFDGTGVGLALVQKIVHRHGGRVWAEGKIDGGATFWFALPRGAAGRNDAV